MSQRFYRSHSVPLLAFGSSIQASEYLIRRSYHLQSTKQHCSVKEVKLTCHLLEQQINVTMEQRRAVTCYS